MLDYEVCKQLKKAGFPQDTERHYYWTATVTNTANNQEEKVYQVCRIGEEITLDSVLKCAAPTLSELIKAYTVEVKFFNLEYDQGWNEVWRACTDKREGFGNTSEEAVSNLYLAIKGNEKQ